MKNFQTEQGSLKNALIKYNIFPINDIHPTMEEAKWVLH